MRVDDIVKALKDERAYSNSGLRFRATASRWEEDKLIVGIEPIKSHRSQPIDESLEGSRANWEREESCRGEVFVASSDSSELVIRYPTGSAPREGDIITLYPRDFLTPLIEMWTLPVHRIQAVRLTKKRSKRSCATQLRSSSGIFCAPRSSDRCSWGRN